MNEEYVDVSLKKILEKCEKRVEEGKKAVTKLGNWSRPKAKYRTKSGYDGDYLYVHRVVDMRKM